jgi:hypothetical protein
MISATLPAGLRLLVGCYLRRRAQVGEGHLLCAVAGDGATADTVFAWPTTFSDFTLYHEHDGGGQLWHHANTLRGFTIGATNSGPARAATCTANSIAFHGLKKRGEYIQRLRAG